MEPTIYKPSIYKGAGIYKTGAEGGGGSGGFLFFTDGSITIDNKNKANPGGLTSKVYDSNFYLTTDKLFHVNNNDVEWAGGFSPPNYATGKFEISADLKNIFSPHTGGRLLSFGGSRFVEFGYLTDSNCIVFGFALVNNSWAIVYNYENPNWTREFQGSDHFWKNTNLPENSILKAKMVCEKKIDRWNFILYVNTEKVYDIDIVTTSNFGNFIGTRFVYNGFIEFGNIKITQIID